MINKQRLKNFFNSDIFLTFISDDGRMFKYLGRSNRLICAECFNLQPAGKVKYKAGDKPCLFDVESHSQNCSQNI